MDLNVILAVASLLLFVALLGYFGFIAYHQQQVEPEEKPATGVELLRQHYEPGDTVEQPTPYWVAPIPSAPDPLEIAGNLDRKIVAARRDGLRDVRLSSAATCSSRSSQADPLSLRAAAVRSTARAFDRARQESVRQLLLRLPRQDRVLEAARCDKDGEPMPGKPLNNPAFKYETLQNDPAKLQTTEDFLRLTISRGEAESAAACSRCPRGPTPKEAPSTRSR